MDSEINDKSDGGLFPDKYAEYFSKINPLAGRIYEDIKKVENKFEDFSKFSYDEKCRIIDKHLLKRNSKNDPFGLEKLTHTENLLLSMYPKKFDEENGCWIDAPTGDFNTCTKSQLSGCNLPNLVGKISLPSIQKQNRSSISRKPKAPAPTIPYKPLISTLQAKSATNVTFPTSKLSENTKQKPKFESRKEDEDELLPNQKQNSDLIAELQAKLKRNKANVKSPTDESGAIKNILKPRAPPPPLPKQKTSNTNQAFEKDDHKIKPTAYEEDFVVDVSSPCRIATPKTGLDFLDNW